MIDYSDLIGVPFANRGRDIRTGLDCYGLVQEVFRRYGHNIPEYVADFDDREKVDALIRQKSAIQSNWRRIEKGEELPVPCLMAIRFGVPKGFINHTGCYIGDGQFIHIRANIGVCVDRINSPAWRHLIEGFYAFVGDGHG